MRRHPVAGSPIASVRQRLLAFLALIAVFVGPLAVAQPAGATSIDTPPSHCAYDLCEVTFTTKSGNDFLAARAAPEASMGAINNQDLGRARAKKIFSFQDVGDGTVFIRDFWNRCLTSPSGDAVQFEECTFAPNERWYFQGQGQPGLFAIRHYAAENGDLDDRCLDVNNGHPGPGSWMHLYRCKKYGADWQMFNGSSRTPENAPATIAGIYDRASRYASQQCEKKQNITCSYTPGATAQPALTAPEMLASTAINYQATPVKDTIAVKTSKSATVSWGFSQKLTVKVKVGILGFNEEEWALENAWSFNKATTDVQEISQSVEVMVPVNAMAWVSYAQLTTEVKGNIRFLVGDTGRGWTGQSTVILPTKNDGSNASVMVICDSLSTNSYCTKTRPAHMTRAATIAPRAADVEWLVTAEGNDHACSGAAIDESWVLTAKHCIDATQVRYPGAGGAGADVVAVDRIIDSPKNDVRLLHLAQPHALSAYPSLDLGYQPHDGDESTAFTVGTPDDPRPVSRTSTVTGERDGDAIGVRTDMQPDLAIDSGGPLVVGDKLVGVASVADSAASIMTFANLRSAADMIRRAVDLDARVSIDVAPTVVAGSDSPVAVSRSSARGPASLTLGGSGGMTPADTTGSLDRAGTFATTARVDAWATPGSIASVTASADGHTARGVSRVIGANAVGAGTDVWGGLGVRTGGWSLAVTRPDQLKPVFPSPIVQSASNKTSVAVVLADGTVWGAGQNGYHELSATDGPIEWTQVPGLQNVVQIAMTEYSTAALLADGSVVAWGSAGYGQLGGGVAGGDVWSSPRRVDELSNVVQVVASPASAYAVLADGTVRAAGCNDAGQLGDGTTSDQSTYVAVQGATDVISVATVGRSATALRSDGTLLFWGADENARPVPPRAVPGAEHVRSLGGGIALKEDGTVSVVQVAGSGLAPVDGLTDVSAVAGTGASFWALRGDGALVAWGRNENGQLGDGSRTDQSRPVKVTGTEGRAVTGVFPSVVGNKTLITVGEAAVDLRVAPLVHAGDAVAVSTRVRNASGPAVGASVAVATSNATLEAPSGRTADRGVFETKLAPGAWARPGTSIDVTASSGGASASGRSRIAGANALGVGAGTWGGLGSRTPGWPVRVTTPDQLRPVFTSPIVQLASNGGSALALLEDGSVWGTGQNGYREVLGKEGPVSDWTRIEGLPRVRQITMTEFSSAALDSDGTVWAWGTSGYGQLGSGSAYGDVWSSPRKVDELAGIARIEGAGGTVYAVGNDGTVWAAGFNDAGQLGDGKREDSHTFARVPGLDAVTSVAAYWRGAMALKDDGSVVYWGPGHDGSPVTPTVVPGLENVAAVSGRVVLLLDGSVRVVSADGTSSATVEGLHDVVSVRGDGSSFYAILPGGSVKAWGSNDSGQLGDGTTVDRDTPVDMTGLQGQPVTAVFTSTHRNKAFVVTGEAPAD